MANPNGNHGTLEEGHNMPTYDLQYKTQTGTVDCGRVLVSMAGGSVSINYKPQGQGGNGVAIPNATYTAAGGGTATSPNPGDLLNLEGTR